MAGISGVESLFPASSRGITDRADGGFLKPFSRLLYGFIYSQRIPDLAGNCRHFTVAGPGFWSRYITISSAVAATQVIVRKSRVADDGLIRFAVHVQNVYCTNSLNNSFSALRTDSEVRSGPRPKNLFTFRGEFPDQCLNASAVKKIHSQPRYPVAAHAVKDHTVVAFTETTSDLPGWLQRRPQGSINITDERFRHFPSVSG
ncbi:Uncharacterised protein [Klebsiella pneumoniae]|nr:Uncharacterised protein [Klebsiella pneumoniae]